MDWHGNRSNEHFVFRRVTYPGFQEMEDYGQITGGSVELSALSSQKVSGSLDFVGYSVPNDRDLVRVYYRFEDENGEEADECLATMFFSCSEPVFVEDMVKGTLDCSSVLSLLSKKCYGLPYTVTAGTNAVAKAVEIVKSFGLQVNNPDYSAYEIKEDHVFSGDDNFLVIVNWLLESAGFSSCHPDERGIVQITRYQEPGERNARYTFRDDERSIMYPEMKRTNDYQATPNVAILRHVTEQETIWASASNIDPDSPTSTVSRGYENTITEEVSELGGETQYDRLSLLKAKALKKLIDNSSDIEYVEMTHCWLPIAPNDAIGVEYASAGLSWKGAITNVGIELKPSIPCKLKARRFVRDGIKTSVTGGVI